VSAPERGYNDDIVKHHDKFDHRAHHDDLHRRAYEHVYDDFHPIFYDDNFLDYYFPPCNDDDRPDGDTVRHRSGAAVPGRDDTADRDHVRGTP